MIFLAHRFQAMEYIALSGGAGVSALAEWCSWALSLPFREMWIEAYEHMYKTEADQTFVEAFVAWYPEGLVLNAKAFFFCEGLFACD